VVKNLAEVGLDSLMALELRNRLGMGMPRALPLTVVIEHPSVEEIAVYLLSQIQVTA